MAPDSLQPELLELSEHVVNTCGSFDYQDTAHGRVFWQRSYEGDLWLAVEARVQPKNLRKRPLKVNNALLSVAEGSTKSIARVDRVTALTTLFPHDELGAYVIEMFAKYYRPESSGEAVIAIVANPAVRVSLLSEESVLLVDGQPSVARRVR